MSKKLTSFIVIIGILMIPLVYGAVQRSSFIFLDETPGFNDIPGTYTLYPSQFESESTKSHLILRMGSNVVDYDGTTAKEKWSWQKGILPDPNNPGILDTIDYQGDGRSNDVAFISGTSQNKVIIRTGVKESTTEKLWEKELSSKIEAIAATDYDGDGWNDDLIVASGQRIYVFKPSANETIIDFPTPNLTPLIITPADLDEDGKKNDIVIGTWQRTIQEEGETITGGRIVAYFADGSQGWSFPPTPLEKKVTYLKAYDRDSDGKDDDLLVVFTDDIDVGNVESNLYVVSNGNQIDFRSDIAGVSPADFDKDGILDDFVLLYADQIRAVLSDLNYLSESTKTPKDYNTTLASLPPEEFIGVASLSFHRDSKQRNIFDDIAIFSRISDKERALLFVENFATETTTTTTTSSSTTTTTTSTTTTTLPPKPPSAKISGLSEGTAVQLGSVLEFSAGASQDPDGEIISYQWLLDGVLKGTNPDYSLSTSSLSTGFHEITLRVTDNDGMEGSTTLGFTIAKGNLPPIADAGEDVQVMEGDALLLTAEGSSDPDGEIESFEWSMDGTVFSLEKSVERVFEVGEHEVTLKVTDNEGSFTTDKIMITVVKRNQPPVADAGRDETVVEGDPVTLSAKDSTDPDGTIISFVWLLPDGKTIEKEEFTATFPAGVHNIGLNVTDDKGSTASDEVIVTVKEAPSTLERIRIQYGTDIKIGFLTLIGLVIALVLFLRSRQDNLY